MSKKLAAAIIISLLGIFLLYEFRLLTTSLLVFMVTVRFVVAWVVVLLWAIFLGLCVRGVLEGLHLIKHTSRPVIPLKPPRVGHFA
jgi:hypothetical protein